MHLDSKIAIVTGASSGLGIDFSNALIAKGTTVYGAARSIDKLNRVQKELGEHFIPVALDVTDRKAIRSWVDRIFTDQHQPDILVNNAGLGLFGKIDELPEEEWDTMISTNLTGVYNMARSITPLMKENEAVCHIINIASIAGLLGNPEMTGYNASKFGVRGFSEALFKELRYDGIKVSCMFPGSVATHFFDNVGGTETHSNMMQPEDVAQVLINLLETPDNFLINEITMRPLNPKRPEG